MLSCPPGWDVPADACAAPPARFGRRGETVGPLRPPSRLRPSWDTAAQTVSAVPRTASTASTTNPANQARIVRYAVAGTGWLLIRSVPIRVIW